MAPWQIIQLLWSHEANSIIVMIGHHRFCAQELSVEQFVARFEAPRLPVVLTGLCDSWPAAERWTPEGLMLGFAHHKFKVCPDDVCVN